jgi:hypothetical protein
MLEPIRNATEPVVRFEITPALKRAGFGIESLPWLETRTKLDGRLKAALDGLTAVTVLALSEGSVFVRTIDGLWFSLEV